MAVSQVVGGPAGGASGSSVKKQTVDYNAFLQLLVAQMKNQDPLNPAEGTELMAQLASFSNVEQGIQTNAKLDAILTSSMLGQADAIIGRTITTQDGASSGVVLSVSIVDNTLMASLGNGQRIPITSGVTIS